MHRSLDLRRSYDSRHSHGSRDWRRSYGGAASGVAPTAAAALLQGSTYAHVPPPASAGDAWAGATLPQAYIPSALVQADVRSGEGGGGQQPAQGPAMQQQVLLSLKVMVAAGTACAFHVGGGQDSAFEDVPGLPVGHIAGMHGCWAGWGCTCAMCLAEPALLPRAWRHSHACCAPERGARFARPPAFPPRSRSGGSSSSAIRRSQQKTTATRSGRALPSGSCAPLSSMPSQVRAVVAASRSAWAWHALLALSPCMPLAVRDPIHPPPPFEVCCAAVWCV